jgi:hypothetical protein
MTKENSQYKIIKVNGGEVRDYNQNKISHQQKIILDKLINLKKINGQEMEVIDASFVNKVYVDNAKENGYKEGKEETIFVAANFICNQGEQMKKIIEQEPKQTEESIGKISGGTLSQVIQKIAEMLMGTSPEQAQEMLPNILAFLQVFGLTNQLGEMFKNSVSILVNDPSDGEKNKALLSNVYQLLKDQESFKDQDFSKIDLLFKDIDLQEIDPEFFKKEITKGIQIQQENYLNNLNQRIRAQRK